ncbi:MAG: glucose-6-phosphate isomerase [Acidimicrobiaceae bacterium]|nr:glucose-6-phosphate isomerase [Acidimicrobiaceae bacterium]MYG98659.1 glucose-6-phosphate isomerase [Acidimicrobiaceae bacterium]MYL02581.1 glucose-6-phosphate isomerase [Acidimicrobiaceae bacterium]
MASTDITAAAEWTALARHARELQAGGVHLRELFSVDPGRVGRLALTAGDLVIDCSRHLVTAETVELLLALADRAGVSERIAATMAGDPVNATEGRPALHTALRAGPGASVVVGDVDVTTAVSAELNRMAGFARAVLSGERRGATGRPIRTVVNLGIGGSYLGLAMAHEALAAFRRPGVECRFVSNVDPADLATVLDDGLDPAETLFVVVSKSFGTPETLANARAARAWLSAALGPDAADHHFAAATANAAAATEFGVRAGDVFRVWDWVGGRYSLGSAAGLSLMLAIGEERFGEMLAGMRAVDEHLVQQPPVANAPVLMGLLGVWYRNFWGLQSRAVVPYSHRLRSFGSWLQQVVMESNGKRVRLDGNPVGCDTGEVVWGGTGTDSQHSFHQFLHQGTTVVPADFIVFARPDVDTAHLPEAGRQHESLVANCFAQAAALAFGMPSDDPHRELPGNRPSTVIMAPELTPSVLGQLVALYEHEVLVQGALWGINSFDQFGVEHGKTLADAITGDLSEGSSRSASEHDPATESLIAHYHRLRATND